MKLVQRLAEYIAPVACVVCGNNGELVCADCRDKLLVTKRPTCFRCNRLTTDGRTCSSCRSSVQLAGASVASHYDGPVKELILALKFNNAISAAEIIAELLIPLLADKTFDLVISVPTTAGRYRRRGYNQARLIAQVVAAKLALPYRDSLRRLGSARQLGHSRQERLQQLSDSIIYRSTLELAGARILLIDDVMTTGATMAECAAVLKTAGAKSVWGGVIAKH